MNANHSYDARRRPVTDPEVCMAAQHGIAHKPTDRRPLAPTGYHTYAAELDAATCEACQALAGLEYTRDDPAAPSIPNPTCTSTSGCRCTWLS